MAPEARRELQALETMLAEREKPTPHADVQRQEAIVEALAELQHESAARRNRALGEIVSLRAVEAIPHLLPWLDAKIDARQRGAAIQVLMALDAVQAVPELQPLLDAEPAEVRQAAAQALAMFDDAESRPRVAAVLAEGIDRANKDQLWYLGLTGVQALAPQLERVVADGDENVLRRWGATQALGLLGVPGSAKTIAAMIDGLATDASLSERDRQELLTVGLRALSGLDGTAHRQLFRRYATADENEVRDAAVAGLARLGDAEARAELRRRSPWQAIGIDLPDDLRQRLEGTRLRLSQVRGNTLRDVVALLEKALGMPIVVSKQADPKLLDGRFQGQYISLLGLRPQALAVLGVVNRDFFSGGTLVPRFHPDRIELSTPEEAGLSTGR